VASFTLEEATRAECQDIARDCLSCHVLDASADLYFGCLFFCLEFNLTSS
jgi:hypothetical protein